MRAKALLTFRALLLATLLLIVHYSAPSRRSDALGAFFIFYALISCGAYLAERLASLPESALLSAFVVDIGLAAWILHLAGAVESHFYVAFFLIILGSAFLEKLAYSFIVGGVACVVYAAMAFPSPEAALVPAHLLGLALLLIISFFSATIAHYIRSSQESVAARYEKKIAWMERLSLLGHALSAILHDLKTPLSAIDLNAERLSEMADVRKNQEASRRLEAIQAESEKASAVVKDHLDFLKPSAEGPDRADLRGSLSKVLAARQAQLERQKIHLTFAAGATSDIPIGERQLMRAFDNVVANAAEAMPDGGNLGVWITNKDGRSVVAVADTGVGMGPEALDRVFEPSASSSSKGPGRGFGLAIARWIVVRHGGDIAVRSELGRGTTIEISLPVIRAKA